MLNEPEISRTAQWSQLAFGRAVMDLAAALGWELAPMPPSARVRSTPGSPVSIPLGMGSSLMLVRRRDRRMIFAVLCQDGTLQPGPAHRRLIEQLHALEWDAAADEHAQAVAALGHSVPVVETFVWRPKNLLDESIHMALRRRGSTACRHAADDLGE